jgi:16S rRNA (adenine1518-N6/adenine1519-N6)-dimethyltransferase
MDKGILWVVRLQKAGKNNAVLPPRFTGARFSSCLVWEGSAFVTKMNLPLLSPTRTQQYLNQLGVRPRKSLGQNFLVDANLVRKSIEMARLKPGMHVVEIGPGLGTLTRGLLNSGVHVYAVERDPVMVQHLQQDLLPNSEGKLDLLEADAVDSPRGNLPSNSEFHIVANLPYAITSPWLESILDGPLPERMVLLVQREAASRLLAKAGSKSLGAISLFLQAAYEDGGQHPVARTCFYPAPDVDSVLMCLQRRPEPFLFSNEQRKWIREIFTMRRKQLRSVCKRQGLDTWFGQVQKAGLPEGVRAEKVPLELWQKIG